jgi:hypothetical protein
MPEKVIDGKVYCCNQSLLGAWFCIDERVPEEENFKKIFEKIHSSNSILETPGGIELLKDRLYGGFRCAQDENRRHVYFNLSQYSFTQPDANVHLTLEERTSWFNRMMEEPLNDPKGTKDGRFIGGKQFMEGCEVKW